MAEVSVSMIGSLRPWKGISGYCESLFEGLQAEDVAITFYNWRSLYPSFLYPGGSPKKTDEWYDHENVRTLLQWWNPFSWLYAGLTFKGDILHAQWWSWPLAPAYWTILALAQLRRKTVLLTIHNVDPHEQSWWKNALNRSVYTLADHFIVHSKTNQEQLQEKNRIASNRIHVIPHPPIRLPDKGTAPEEARRIIGLEEDATVILFFGNIRPYKGLDRLLDAMPDILEEEPTAHLLIVGKPWDDWGQYETQIHDLGLEDHVTAVLEYVPDEDVEQYFRAADVVVLPYTHFDAQSGIPEIAHQFNVPVIGTDVGGLGDQTDFVTPTENLSEKIPVFPENSQTVKKDEKTISRTIELYVHMI